MTTATEVKGRLFVTDYASYNEGTQFEFGKWFDLEDYDYGQEFLEAVQEHLEEADEERPLEDGSKREELMFTDYEGFPSEMYGECLNADELDKIYKYIEIIKYIDGNDENWLDLHNTYCQNMQNENEIYNNDEDFFETYFSGRITEAVRGAIYGDYNFANEYVMFNGYGNLESFDNILNHIDENEIIEDIIENPENYNL